MQMHSTSPPEALESARAEPDFWAMDDTSQWALEHMEPRARIADPVTSHLAAASAKELQARHHQIILAALDKNGPAGKDRIAALTRLTGVQVCRRLGELEKLNKARPTGRTVKSSAGRQEREWMAW